MLSNDPIGKISFATGGEKDDYNVVTYVAKDKRDNRCTYTLQQIVHVIHVLYVVDVVLVDICLKE